MFKKPLVILKLIIFIIITAGIVSFAFSYRIDNIYSNINKYKYKYSSFELTQAAKRIIRDNGSPAIWAADKEHVISMFKKYLFINKDCVKGKKAHFIQKKFLWNDIENSTNLNLFLSGDKIIFNNGKMIKISEFYNDKSVNNDKIYAVISLNINPSPKTNKQDIFFFVLKNDGLYPAKFNSDGSFDI